MSNPTVMERMRLRHRGRDSQIPIYLGKLFRSFIYQNDWKLLPMAAVIAAMLAMVIRRTCFVTMEGTKIGAFGITCVAIWNGCFNSIQSVCRERAILKREHRSGLHISSYICAHMIYQAFLCLLQTGLTLYVCSLMGMKFPAGGVITSIGILDIGITVFLISYASDMISLFVSSLAHTTTAAMTVMPFLLIFQLVFSGGMFTLPTWAENLSDITISNYGLKCISAQSDYNNLPMVTAWNTLSRMQDDELSVTVTGSQLLAILQKEDNDAVKQLRSGEVIEGSGVTLGQVIDSIAASPDSQEALSQPITVPFTLRELMNLWGEDKVEATVKEKTAATMRNADFDNTVDNIVTYWIAIILIGLVFAALSVILLEFIDRDKR